MNVAVPNGMGAAFVAEVATKPEWYVAKKYTPEASKGDQIRFYEGGTLIATAVVDRIVAPGESDINMIDRNDADRWIVWFGRETFRVASSKKDVAHEDVRHAQ